MNASRGFAVMARIVITAGIVLSAGVAGRFGTQMRAAAARADEHGQLLALFSEWRTFQKPPLVNGVPQYTLAAMNDQYTKLPEFQRRLAALDPHGWIVPEPIDWHLLRAEMNGLDFDQRVRKPWANDPAFYVTFYPSRSDQPLREGPVPEGAIELWTYTFPLSAERANALDGAIRIIPPLLEQARTNLTGSGKDLWTYGARRLREQSADLAALATRVADTPGPLKQDVERARAATDDFARWVEAQAPSKTGTSGVGIDNYDWYLKHVQLVPYTWRDEVVLMQRELDRANAMLAMLEERDARLPVLQPITDGAEYERRFTAAVDGYLTFLDTHGLLPMRPYFKPALMARMGRLDPGPREFFNEVNYRDPEIMLTHDYHWLDLARLDREPNPNPIRQGPLLYNIFNTRTEGHATGWEELMMNAGMLDDRPRSQEMVYILVAERAARALGDLRMHANQITLEQSAQAAAAATPRNWLRLDARTVREEQELYLEQPAYGTSYISGKIQFEALLSEQKRQLGDRFNMREVMDRFHAAGLIPTSLIRWELSGQLPPDVKAMLDDHEERALSRPK
jgi:hypothetical protein